MRIVLILTVCVTFFNVHIFAQSVNDDCSSAIVVSSGFTEIDLTVAATYSGLCNIDCMLQVNGQNVCARDIWYKFSLDDSLRAQINYVASLGVLYMEIYNGSCGNLQFYKCRSLNEKLPPGDYYIKMSTSIIGFGNLSVNICKEPVLSPIQDVYACSDYTLPPIQGRDLSGNQTYWTSSNGTGTMYSSGSVISANLVLYAFDKTGDANACSASEMFTIDVDMGGRIKKPQFPIGSWFGQFFWGLNGRPEACDEIDISDAINVYVPSSSNVARGKTFFVEDGVAFEVRHGGQFQVGQ